MITAMALAIAAATAITACSDDLDGASASANHVAGTLGITELRVDGTSLSETSTDGTTPWGDTRTFVGAGAGTRAGAEDGTATGTTGALTVGNGTLTGLKPNTAITSLTAGDELYVWYNFAGNEAYADASTLGKYQGTATIGTDGNTVTLTPSTNGALRPNGATGATGESWAAARMKMSVNGLIASDILPFADADMAYYTARRVDAANNGGTDPGAGQSTTGSTPGAGNTVKDGGKVTIPGLGTTEVDERLYCDALVAVTGTAGDATGTDAIIDALNTDETENGKADGTVNKGSIAIDRTLSSDQLGAIRANLAHPGSLMRLKDADITVDGAGPQGTPTTTGGTTTYSGATGSALLAHLWAKVKNGTSEYYVPFTKVTMSDGSTTYRQAIIPGGATVMGFVVVTYSKNTDGSANTATTNNIIVTLAESGKTLTANKRYPLALTVVSSIKATISFTTPEGLDGWGDESAETELIDSRDLQHVSGSGDGVHTYKVLSEYGLQKLSAWINSATNTPALIAGGTEVTKANRLKTNIILANDITMTAPESGSSNWTPIGDSSNRYTGTLDGGGHTLTGMTIDVNYGNVGLIGYLGIGGTVKNLALNNANVNGVYGISGIAGYNYGTITACSTSGELTATGTNCTTGGIASVNYGTITACWSTATAAGTYPGGIAGVNYGTITACWSTATATGTYPGGIAGYYNKGTVTACYTTQATRNGGGTQVADITALNGKVSDMNNALATLNIGYEWAASTNTAKDGPVLKKVVNLTYNATTNTYTAYTATGLMAIDTWLTTSGAAPTGTDGNQWTGDNKFAVKITLGADITLPTVADGSSNWTPIGNYDNSYTGTFDGGGHTLTGMTINVNYNYVGLIGTLGSGGTVKNLTLNNANVTGYDYAGGIAGYNNGTVTACSSAGGKVSATGGGAYVGGITGENEFGTVTACSSAGGNVSATADGAFVGGIAGYNSGGTITACWSTATVSGYLAGGIAGTNEFGTVTACYTTKDTGSSISGVNKVSITVLNSDATINAMNAAITTGSYQWAKGSDLPYIVAK